MHRRHPPPPTREAAVAELSTLSPVNPVYVLSYWRHVLTLIGFSIIALIVATMIIGIRTYAKINGKTMARKLKRLDAIIKELTPEATQELQEWMGRLPAFKSFQRAVIDFYRAHKAKKKVMEAFNEIVHSMLVER